MSMKPAFDIVVAENYQHNGEEKTRWHNIGTMFADKETGKMSIKFVNLVNIPLIKADGWANVFVKKPRENAIESAKQADVDGVESDEPINLDDIPF